MMMIRRRRSGKGAKRTVKRRITNNESRKNIICDCGGKKGAFRRRNSLLSTFAVTLWLFHLWFCDSARTFWHFPLEGFVVITHIYIPKHEGVNKITFALLFLLPCLLFYIYRSIGHRRISACAKRLASRALPVASRLQHQELNTKDFKQLGWSESIWWEKKGSSSPHIDDHVLQSRWGRW